MFEGITRGLSDAFKKLRGRGRLTAENIKEGLREVRRAFLEADVNFNVVTDFIARVEAKSLGQDVLARVDPVRTDRQDRLRGTRRADGAGRSRRSRSVRTGPSCSCSAACRVRARRRPRQARADAQGPAAASRCSPPPTCSARCRRAAPDARRADRRAGLQREDEPGRGLPQRRRGGQAARSATRSSSTPPAGCRSTTS